MYRSLSPSAPRPTRNLGATALLATFAVALLCHGLIAAGADVPSLKPGLWEMVRSTQPDDKKHVTTMCLDTELQAQMQEFGMGMAKNMCPQTDRQINGNRLTVTATCKLGESTMKSQSVMTFTSPTAYHTDMSATYDPPFMNMSQTKGTMDGKWLGACKPGQQPGDITLESGQTINLKSMLNKK
jgi:Protein of unknown function (DUF3617)